MPTVHFIEASGTRHSVTVPAGTTLMRAAVDNLIPGIDGDCGGLCACATCHVYIDDGRCGEPDELERGMLEFAFETDEMSRLACQIELTEDLDELEVRLPKRQY